LDSVKIKPIHTSPKTEQSTSAESGKHNRAPLLRVDESKFLEIYALDHYNDMLQNEYKGQFDNLLDNQT